VKANLRVIAERIPAGANLVFVLPSGFSPDGSPRSRNTSHTEWCIQELQDRPNVCFVNIDQAINSVAERNEIGDHFDRIVYYRLALLWHFRLYGICKEHVTVRTSSG